MPKPIAKLIKSWKNSDGNWQISVKCPDCRKIHCHGAGNGEQPELGHKTAFCDLVGGYEVIR
jgi:hypothetical protein